MAIQYADGRTVRVGDIVDFDGTPGTVLDIIEPAERVAAWGLSEPAVFFDTVRDGQLLQSPYDGGWDGIVLLRQADLPKE